jgi:glycerol-3-phosphate dehydrogenase (NAD(P)+)
MLVTKATVVGSGAMGTVMAQVLASGNVRVSLLARREALVQELLTYRENRTHLPGVKLSQHIYPTLDARRAFSNTEVVVSAVPCQHLRAAWEALAPHVPAGVPVCSTTKGIEVESLLRPSQILEQCLPMHEVAVLSGPSIALEVARCLPATVVLASPDEELSRRLQATFSASWFRIYTSGDPLGVELAGALKNVIALAAGILDGLNAGDNAKAALLTRGLVEITRLGVALGAQERTFAGLAGIGDLITTCISPLGRNRAAGERIGRGMPLAEVLAECEGVVEGVPTVRAVMRLAARCGVEVPITAAVNDVLFGGKPPLLALTELMNRPPKSEGVD